MTQFAASLRVYEPLAAFDGAEREHWQAYVGAAGQLPGTAAHALERAATAAAMVHRRLPLLGEHAFVLELDGVTMVCPWRTEVRSREALVDFCQDLPDVVVEAFVPRTLLERAEVELDQWRTDHGGVLSHIRTCTWQVPLRWFVLVDPDERTWSLGESADSTVRRTGRSLVYRTPMSRARRRVAQALAVVRTSLGDDDVTAGLVELGGWLEEFHPRSMVELDYGGLVHLLDDAEIAQDTSAQDMATALTLLGQGDLAGATAVYGRMTARMRALQAVENAN